MHMDLDALQAHWNRACAGEFSDSQLEGDRALSLAINADAYLNNGGIDDLINSDGAMIEDAAKAFAWFGLHRSARILYEIPRLCPASRSLDPEVRKEATHSQGDEVEDLFDALLDEYYSLGKDEDIFIAFAAAAARVPEAFSLRQ